MKVKNELTKRYKNKRKRFSLRMNLIAGIVNGGEGTATFTRAMIQFGEHKSFNNIYSPVALFLSTAKKRCEAKANKFNLKHWIRN